MSVPRVIAIILIFAMFTAGWMLLGGTILVRTEGLDGELSEEIGAQWGPAAVVQTGPYLTNATGSTARVAMLARHRDSSWPCPRGSTGMTGSW